MTLRNFAKAVYRKLNLAKPHAFLKFLFTPYGYLRNSIIFPLQGFFRTHGFAGENEKKIEALKNKHKGERVFIIATGPSLTMEDVALLKNEHTIGVNAIFKVYDKIDWIPDYYMFLDKPLFENFYNQGLIDLEHFAKNNCFINSICDKIGDSSKTIYLHTCWLDHFYNHNSRKFKYNPNLAWGIYDYFSVSHSAILLAIYLGFKDIYFLGVDNNYLGKFTHSKVTATTADEKLSYETALRMQQAMDSGYEEIARIGNKMGVNIYNATRGGRVEAFPRVNLEDVVGK